MWARFVALEDRLKSKVGIVGIGGLGHMGIKFARTLASCCCVHHRREQR